MSSKFQFPWEALKAECLRTVCTQLMQSTGAHYSEVRRREDMIAFLTDVEHHGLDKTAAALLETLKNEAKAPRPVSAAKRKAEATDDDDEYVEEEEEGADGYNTRFKGVKRVKVHATRSPRKKQPASANASAGAVPTVDGEGAAESASAAPPVKRGRGRPRKSVVSDNNNGAAAATAKTSVSAASVAVTVAEKSEGAPVKRGRGRPRKSDVGGGATATATSTSTSARARTRTRTKAPTPATATATTSTSATTPGKRPRGRPRKHPLPATASAPNSKGKEVFDGVLLQKRSAPAKDGALSAEGATEPGEEGGEDAAGQEQEEEEEEDIDPVLRNGHLDDGASSLAGSNKENEPAFSSYTPDPADAQGEPDSTVDEAVHPETAQTVDLTQSAVIMPTIPMALAAAAASNSNSAAPSPGPDRPVLQPL